VLQYQEATRLVPVELRRQFILIGGTASIAHSSRRWTEDVDVAASLEAHNSLLEAIRQGARNFKVDSTSTIVFDSRQGFTVNLESLELGGSFIETVAAIEPFHEGFVASLSDLLVFRAVTVVDRGDNRDWEDFYWLLESMAKTGSLLMERVDGWDEEVWTELVAKLTLCERLLLFALFPSGNLRVLFNKLLP
jgi:hypothetical protein